MSRINYKTELINVIGSIHSFSLIAEGFRIKQILCGFKMIIFFVFFMHSDSSTYILERLVLTLLVY